MTDELINMLFMHFTIVQTTTIGKSQISPTQTSILGSQEILTMKRFRLHTLDIDAYFKNVFSSEGTFMTVKITLKCLADLIFLVSGEETYCGGPVCPSVCHTFLIFQKEVSRLQILIFFI